MRGAFIIPGGPAQLVTNTVDNKLHVRGGGYLLAGSRNSKQGRPQLLSPQIGKVRILVSFARLCLKRLTGSLIMSDTCNAACATSNRQLASVVRQQRRMLLAAGRRRR
eukprot:6211822-Pleurochrysis_carterae.AAC.3